jgi:hypothetical protein
VGASAVAAPAPRRERRDIGLEWCGGAMESLSVFHASNEKPEPASFVPALQLHRRVT